MSKAKRFKDAGIHLYRAECSVCGTSLRPMYLAFYGSMTGGKSFGCCICARCAKTWQKAAKNVWRGDDTTIYTTIAKPKKGGK